MAHGGARPGAGRKPLPAHARLAGLGGWVRLPKDAPRQVQLVADEAAGVVQLAMRGLLPVPKSVDVAAQPALAAAAKLLHEAGCAVLSPAEVLCTPRERLAAARAVLEHVCPPHPTRLQHELGAGMHAKVTFQLEEGK